MLQKEFLEKGNKEFQYKICYSKIFVVCVFDLKIKIFQYKICYSKIKGEIRCWMQILYFNTKFVIAK